MLATGRASFEARLRRAPQDDEFEYAQGNPCLRRQLAILENDYF